MSGPILIVYGIIEPDDAYNKKVKAWEACKAANVDPPEVLQKYFDYTTPDIEGMRLLLARDGNNLAKGVVNYGEESEIGVVINLTKLDPRIKKIKVINSY